MRSASPGTTCQAPPGRRAPGRPWSPGSARRRRLRPAMHPDQTGRHEAPTDSSPGRAQTSEGQADAGASRRPRPATAIADKRWFRPVLWPCFPTYQSGRLARPALAVSGRAASTPIGRAIPASRTPVDHGRRAGHGWSGQDFRQWGVKNISDIYPSREDAGPHVPGRRNCRNSPAAVPAKLGYVRSLLGPSGTPDLAQVVDADIGHANSLQLGTGLVYPLPVIDTDPGAEHDAPPNGLRDVGTGLGVAAFGAADEVLGGGHGLTTVTAYLADTAAPMLKGSFATDHARRQEFGAVSELTYLAGWKHHDLGHEGAAQRYYQAGFQLACEADPHAHAGWMMRAIAHQALSLKQPHFCIDLIEGALKRSLGFIDGGTEALLHI